MAVIKKGEIISIAYEHNNNGQHYGFSYWNIDGSGSWRSHYNNALRFDGLVGLPNQRGLPELTPISP